jgi:hypothetical protein
MQPGDLVRLWCNVLMSDGPIWIPGWCVRRVGDDETR